METKFGNAELSQYGYYIITDGKHHGKRLHRLIYEDYHGYLADTDAVHHLDGDKTNNDLSNLIAMDIGEHVSYHRKGNKLSEQHKKNIGKGVMKSYPRVVKDGTSRGKQRYVLRHNGESIKHSVNLNTLIDYAKELGLDNVIVEV